MTLVKKGGLHPEKAETHPSWPNTLEAYGELMRIHRPLGFYLNTSPYLVGIAFAACSASSNISSGVLAKSTTVLILWSFCLRCAGCVWNDLIDADLDGQISRTKTRPIPRGAVSKLHAVFLTLALFSFGGFAVSYLPRNCMLDGLIITFFALLYPFGKRFTNYPQLTLANIGWAVPMAMHSIGVDPLARLAPTVCMYMFIATVIIMIDVVYATQDTEEDIKVGVKSLAVRFKDSIQTVVYSLLYASTAFLMTAGALTGLGWLFVIVSVGGHFAGFSVLLQATLLGRSSKVEDYSKSAFMLATICWVGGFVVEYRLRD